MNNTIRNLFGVAAAIILLLGLNVATDKIFEPDNSAAEYNIPEYASPEVSAEQKEIYSLKDLNDELVAIAEKSNPSVVTITTEKTQQVRVLNPFAQFFGYPDAQEEQEYIQRGLGSGVIVSKDGYILTNNHVIDGVDEINVALFNGDEVKADIVGSDPETDIAVLKINSNDDLPAISMGNSDNLKVGSFVLAIGSPLDANLAHTVSFGIVSAKGRALNNLTIFGNYIQTDAAINPGNSGGALIDMNGQLVGINSAIASRSGGNDGIGFAIPVNLAKNIMEDLIDDGSVSRGYLGLVLGGEVDRTMAKALRLDRPGGIIIGQIEKGGPADKAGLKEEDIIVSLNGNPVESWDAFRNQIAAKKPGEKVKLEVIRDNKRHEYTVTLGNRESIAANTPGNSEKLNADLGFSVRNLSPAIKQQLNLDDSVKGVLVSNISQSSNAYSRGLRQNDVIVKVKNESITNAGDFNKAINKALRSDEEVVLLTILRNDITQYIAFEL